MNQKGFTLVEVVITVSVVGIVLGIVSLFAINSLTQSSVQSARADLLGESQIALDNIISDVRLSAGADDNNRHPDPNNGGDLSMDWQSDATTLVLATAAVDNNNDIIFSDPVMYISEKNNVIYFVDQGVLYERVLASDAEGNNAKTTCPKNLSSEGCPEDKVMLNNVTKFEVKYFDNNDTEVTPTNARSVEISVETNVKKFGRDIKAEYVTRAVFRND